MPANTAIIFISAVTDEFKSHRDAVAKWLDLPGTRIETQEKFLATGVTMLVKLSDYIHRCDAVVHLVGDRTGNESGGIASPVAVQCLLEAHRDLPHALGLTTESIAELSYTQWEAWLAIYHKKRLFMAVPEANAPRDKRLEDQGKRQTQSEHQKAHLAALADRGRYPEIRFANSDQLCLGLVPLRDILISGTRSELALINIMSLAEYRASLAGFRRFLSSSNLPFQAPRRGDPCHPEELLKSLETSIDARGVLLAGAGGVGKTRTTFETAQLAESRGWRVIYALPGQPAVTAERIIEAVLAHGPGKTIAVIEYLDQMHELDLGLLRRHLIQASTQHGIQFGLMANCRPGLLLKVHRERDATFDTVTLVPSAHEAQSLSRYVALHSAPQALDILGEPELMRLCGHRPIISLLVAQQLEQLARASTLQRHEFTAVRSGDLAHWLRRRLAEDGLFVPQAESIWDTAAPPPHLVAAATALACAPDGDAALTAGVASALQAIGKPDSIAARITAVLVAVGWLEREGPWLHVVHDVVADELAEQCIFELEGIRHSELRAVLSPALSRARSLGRLAKTFTRVEGALSDQKASLLRSELERWLKDVALRIGKTLATDEAGNGSYALGAVLGGSILEDFAIEEWPRLVTPWLAKHRVSYEARHLLFHGLRAHHQRILADLIPIAMTWLERWRNGQSASFVFEPLLRVIPPGEAVGGQLMDWSLAWLYRFTFKPEAEFVFHTLLERKDLKGEVATQAMALALQWLAHFIDKPSAGHVLPPLLGREDLKGELATHAMALALQWLADFNDKPAAGHVLPRLLEREDLKDGLATHAMALALQWLADFNDKPAAGHVLPRLLEREDLKGELATHAMVLALQWLADFIDKLAARFVLSPLLAREDLKDEVATQATALALQWLSNFIDNLEAGFVLAPLVGRKGLEGEVATQTITLALQWLLKFPANEQTDFVLKSTLVREDLEGEVATQAMALALQWLADFSDKPEAGFVLAPLLGRKDLKGEAAARAMTLALQWLEKFPANEGTDFVLKTALGREDLKGETATQVIALALHWLMDFTAKPQAQFVFNRLLARKDLKGEAATQAMALALQWLADFIDKLDAQFVFHPLLERKDLKGKAAAQAMALALQWLAEFADKPEGGFVLAPLVGRADLKGELATQTVTLALRWTERFGHTEKAGFVLVEWCLSAGTIEIPNRIQELALEWSAKYKSCGGGLPALVLRLCALRPDNPDAKKIVMSALSWVRAHERHPLIGQALVALLQKHAAIDGVVDVTVASGLNAGWNFETGNVRKSLCIALDLLPPSDSRRGEIEALLESVD